MIGARINVRERNRTELCCDGGRQGELRKDSRTVERTTGGKKARYTGKGCEGIRCKVMER